MGKGYSMIKKIIKSLFPNEKVEKKGSIVFVDSEIGLTPIESEEQAELLKGILERRKEDGSKN